MSKKANRVAVETPANVLTPNQRIHAAHLRFNMGKSMDDLAAFFPGVNGGRISEAVKAIELAANHPKAVREYGETPPSPRKKK
jgi:hypothetical protein